MATAETTPRWTGGETRRKKGVMQKEKRKEKKKKPTLSGSHPRQTSCKRKPHVT
uniref:Uncharacterized protein n=1 Tax=Anguilla anguilla TaxID=7936 RepID=A0A0E9X9V9_ANGAN